MTFFISSISAEVCRGKKTNLWLRYRVGSVRSLFNKWLGWFGWAGEELPWFFFKMISDRVSRLRLWQRAASPSMCFRLQGRSSSSSLEWRENVQMDDVAVRPGAPRYFNLLLQKETSTSNVGGASWRSPSSHRRFYKDGKTFFSSYITR